MRQRGTTESDGRGMHATVTEPSRDIRCISDRCASHVALARERGQDQQWWQHDARGAADDDRAADRWDRQQQQQQQPQHDRQDAAAAAPAAAAQQRPRQVRQETMHMTA